MEIRISASTIARFDALIAQLHTARIDAGFLQQEFAAQLGVSARALRDWEHRFDDPTASNFLGWIRALGFRLTIEDPTGSPSLPPVRLDEGETWETHETRRLAAALWTRRRARRTSQAELGASIGVTRSSIVRWEGASQRPRPLVLVAWVESLGCRLSLTKDVSDLMVSYDHYNIHSGAYDEQPAFVEAESFPEPPESVEAAARWLLGDFVRDKHKHGGAPLPYPPAKGEYRVRVWHLETGDNTEPSPHYAAIPPAATAVS